MIYFTCLLTITILHFLPSVSSSFRESHHPCGYLYLTQSPYKKKNIQLNWNFTCDDLPDTIWLTFKDIRTDTDAKIMHNVSLGTVTKGRHETNFSFKDINSPGNWTEDNDSPDLKAQCFNYYIASVKDNEVIYSQCISIQPAWMSNFGNLRIGEMMIPGTHNSGAWRGGPPLPPLIRNYVLNQDKSFWEQLVYGIRYFDIRIGYYGDTPQGLYINHAFIKCTELLPELQSAVHFLEKSPKEVIILNFYRFARPKNFTLNHHRAILNVVKQTFGNLIFPFYKVTHRQGPKLNEFWSSQQRVIVSYRNVEVIKEAPWLWPSVRRDWGNVQKVQDLENYVKLKTAAPSRGNPMRVLMAELTPNYFYLIKHVTRNLKDLSIMVNSEISDWLRKDNRSDNLNIIATDFFTGNDVINVAIETNFRKLKHFFS